MNGYIDREIVKETEKAYLVKVRTNNPRDGLHENYKWVAKSICKRANAWEDENYVYAMENLPDEIKKMMPRFIAVPEHIIPNCEWGR